MKFSSTFLVPVIVAALTACTNADPDPCAGRRPPAKSHEKNAAIPRFQVVPLYRIQRRDGAASAQVDPKPVGLTPYQLRAAYALPDDGGQGTIAIVDANGDSHAESDLDVFSAVYGLPNCTSQDGCFERHVMTPGLADDPGWSVEISLDVQWAHAVAPRAKILLVEAKSAFAADLLAAVDYASSRPDVVAVSMSWGGGEFSTETFYDYHFEGACGMTFFAASGDGGTGVLWPASSPNVVSVGGTTLTFNGDGTLGAETAWSGSGGGMSMYQLAPDFQVAYGLSGQRAVPDVSANADPASGYSIYDTVSLGDQTGWYQVGGTSGASPVWAAIKALGLSADRDKFYQDASGPDYGAFFRDISSGSNGICGSLCLAVPGYDTVTGLGSPLTAVY